MVQQRNNPSRRCGAHAPRFVPSKRYQADVENVLMLEIARQLMECWVGTILSFRTVVVGFFYNKDEEFKWDLRESGAGYVLALKDSRSRGDTEGRRAARCGSRDWRVEGYGRSQEWASMPRLGESSHGYVRPFSMLTLAVALQ